MRIGTLLPVTTDSCHTRALGSRQSKRRRTEKKREPSVEEERRREPSVEDERRGEPSDEEERLSGPLSKFRARPRSFVTWQP